MTCGHSIRAALSSPPNTVGDDHLKARSRFEKLIQSLPSHLEEDHPFWESKLGLKWKEQNPDRSELAGKQLYNHPDYSIYDETD